ncbi:glycosyltransferase involved in cell wall biosynthesis [Methylobacterium sp. BE186]|uniref:glycosyltransferase n=1 Tax=Methylobacterium sp. BE186 TaxID=2817715 RepID=UPI0028593E30|nr:glycosyltransferase [Methylobacterium sp. BE186]MDR7039143.1 glycosyltransferase involved in cell wall biosynthesis [Methylobacterium sp. BE186]
MRGNFDGLRDGVLNGWAFDPQRPETYVGIELWVDGLLLREHRADRFRSDLRAAGIGSGSHAFMIRIDDAIRRHASKPGARLELRTASDPPLILAQVSLSETFRPDQADPPPDSILRLQAQVLRAAAARPDGAARCPARGEAARSPLYLKLLRGEGADCAGTGNGRDARPRLSPFAAQLGERMGLRKQFPEPSDRDHLYRWYIDHYAGKRPFRAPLSAEEIAYLNEPIVLGGQRYALSRAALWYALEDDGVRSVLDLSSEQGYRRVLYWWACNRAPALNVEDCLVSYRQAAFLQAVPGAECGGFLPFSRFIEEALDRNPNLAFVRDTGDFQTRIACHYAVLLEAAEEPGVLRFVPREVLEHFLLGPEPQFDAVGATLSAANDGTPYPDRETYLAVVAAHGFDIERQAFATVSHDGDRIDAAHLTASSPPDVLPFVQVVAPFGKASGLATAARSTRSVLLASGLPCRFANFSLENPQPAVADDNHVRHVAQGAVVNIIHVNPDLLPLVYAHSPDVFTDAYNIGFFFWELDRIAANHRLALDLVDEIWVASEYNRRCFEAATNKPVRNMRLALPPLAPDGASRARTLMQGLFGTTADDFVFFTSYDSFSYTSRKNPTAVIEAFRAAFPTDSGVRLIIKTHNAATLSDPGTLRAWRKIADACDADARIAIIDRTMRHEEVLDLIAAADCYVSLHRSEGFGLGMLEAMQRRTPVVCTHYSGNADFCTSETAWPVAFDIVPTGADEYAYVEPGHVWADPRHDSAVEALRAVRREHAERARRVENAARLVGSSYEPAALVTLYRSRIDSILAARGTAAPREAALA